ncbi:hypothetical protein V8E54_004673 [Elaphomyces granulatus]
MFDPIEYKPRGTPASTVSTASPTVAPKKATSRVSASSVPLIGGLSVEDTEDTKTLTALENAGFDSIAAFLDAVYTTNFLAHTTCAELQKQAWEDGIPQTLTVLSRHVAATDSYGKRPYGLTPYRNAVTRAAEAEYEREFAGFPKRRDRRQRDRVAGRLTTGSGKSHPGLSRPGHGTGSGPGRVWKRV